MPQRKSQAFYKCIIRLMKSKMEDFIKNIIVEKKFFELTPKEKSMIKEWAENEEEFDELKLTLLAASSFTKEKQVELSPSVKNRLNERFAAKYAQKNESLWNKFLIFFFPSDTQFFKKPAFQLAMVALLVLLIIPFLWQEKPAQYAMQEKNIKIERFEEPEHKENPSTNAKKEVKVETDIAKKEGEELKDQNIVEITQSINEEVQPVLKVEQDIEVSEMYLEEVVEPQAANRMSPDIQQLDEIQMTPNKDLAKKKEANNLPKKVDASETLGLLTALY